MPQKPPSPPLPSRPVVARPPAPHVQAAMARVAQAKQPSPAPRTGPASYVQAALQLKAQLHPPTPPSSVQHGGGASPGRSVVAQAKLPSPPVPTRPPGTSPVVQPLWHSSRRWKLPEGDRPLELGNKLFLWKGLGTAQVLMLSAHGGDSQRGTVRVPRWADRFVFYGPHGQALRNPGLVLAEDVPGDDDQELTVGKHRSGPIEYGSGAEVPNYIFTKFQSAKGETYEDVVGAVGTSRQRRSFDILTVRKRWYGKEVTVSDIITALENSHNTYREIQFNTCRSLMREATKQDAERQNLEMGYLPLDDSV